MILSAGCLYAEPFRISLGGGGYFGSDFGGGVEANLDVLGNSASAKIETPYFGGGGYFFGDFTYAEVIFGLFYGAGTWKSSLGLSLSGLGAAVSGMEGFSESQSVRTSLLLVEGGWYFKYPFAISSGFKLFPLIGLEMQTPLMVRVDNEYEDLDALDDYTTAWLKTGFGMDCFITPRTFLRFEALYGIRVPNKGEIDFRDQMKAIDSKIKAETLLGHGLTVRLAIGFRLW